MVCVACHRFCLKMICQRCLENLSLNFENVRYLSHDLKVITSYRFSEISHLIHAKYFLNGSLILKSLSDFALQKFSKLEIFKNLEVLKNQLAIIYIGEYHLKNFSHAAIIARSFNSLDSKSILKGCPSKRPKIQKFNIIYNALKPQNNLKYSKLNREDRLLATRNFVLTLDKKYKFVVIVDDICTTGQTLQEANMILKENGFKVLFTFCLADSRL